MELPVEKHAGVAHAVACQIQVTQRLFSHVRDEELVQVVIVARNALPLLAQHTAALVPSPQAVSDHHLVPEGSAWLDGRDLGHRQVQIRSFIGNVWLDQDRTVGIERRLRARLDPHGGRT